MYRHANCLRRSLFNYIPEFLKSVSSNNPMVIPDITELDVTKDAQSSEMETPITADSEIESRQNEDPEEVGAVIQVGMKKYH